MGCQPSSSESESEEEKKVKVPPRSSKREASEDDEEEKEEEEEEEVKGSKREASEDEEKDEEEEQKVQAKTICQFYCDHPYPQATIDRKMQQLYDQSLTLLTPNFQGKDLKVTHLEKIFDWVDEYFFAGRLAVLLEPMIGRVIFKIARAYKQTAAGFTSNAGREISINLPIFENIFTDPAQTHMFASGLKCRNRLHCMLLVFCHEVIHVMIEVFCSPRPPHLAEAVKTGGHHQMFRTLARNIFGHTLFTHMLAPEYVVAAETRDTLSDPTDVIDAWRKDKKQLFEYHHTNGRKYWTRITELDESHLNAKVELLRGFQRDGTSFIPNQQLSKKVQLSLLSSM